MSIVADSLSNGFGLLPGLDDVLGKKIKHDVEEDVLDVWDKGVFLNELLKQNIIFKTGNNGSVKDCLASSRGLKQGTYRGTRLALTELYSLIEEAAVSHFDARGFEPIIPRQRDLSEKKRLYQWSNGNDLYPPHLLTIPKGQEEGPTAVGDIFNAQEKGNVGQIAMAFGFIIPEAIDTKEGTPFKGPKLADCEKYNREHPSPKTDIMNGENIGNLADWYADARFAQQHFSGVNPSTIRKAKPARVLDYIAEAGKQELGDMEKLLSESNDLFIQDYSYFREAMPLTEAESEYRNIVPEMTGPPPAGGTPTDRMVARFACAPVVIFQLHHDGRLHPLAITIDHKGTLEKSITLFNRRLTPDAKAEVDEKDDWAWRYAKTCAQTADWARHEVATHLVDTHMVEEAIIVATNRTVDETHILYELLSPHWFRTLALNKAAREILVPSVIARLAGFGPTINPQTSRVMALVNWSYKNFNFQEKYIPTDLKKRGFPVESLTEEKYRNYPYATDMYLLWGVIRDFVESVLRTKYKSDADVQNDRCITDWCNEIQKNGQIPSFPTIMTVDQLIDAATMCIHTASPQHTAVNYLQDYYYSFVPAKPPALCRPLPKDLATLKKYTEDDLTAALPISDNKDNPKWKDWLLAAQLPELLSYKVENQYNLITYAKSLYNVNKDRLPEENKKWESETIKEAAALFYSRLKELDIVFKHVSDRQTEGTIEYKVLQPEVTAVSILI